MSLDQLPYNVILQILWYVSSNKLDFGRFRKTCKRLAEITRDLRFGHLVTCGNSKHKRANVVAPRTSCPRANFDRISCLLLSQKGKNMTIVMSYYVRECNSVNVDVLKFLIEHGANIHHKRDSMMKNALLRGKIDAVKILISCGADIDMQGDNCTMNNAVRSGNLELVKYLIDQGVCVQHPKIILYAARSGNLEMVKFLISIGFNIHEDNDRIISHAAMSGNIELARYLINQGIDVDAESGKALRSCIAIKDIDMAKFLISCGADINNNNGYILILAAKTGNVEFVKYLIEQGLDIHTCYNMALADSMVVERKYMVKFLISLR